MKKQFSYCNFIFAFAISFSLCQVFASIVSTLLAKEVKQGFMIGPFDSPPFPIFRISPIGVATRKYSGKKRLIIDLSSPHGSSVPSINSLIPSSDFSLHYSTVNHAISLISSLVVVPGYQKPTSRQHSKFSHSTQIVGTYSVSAGRINIILQSD